jgi:hypothetical protein
MVGSGNPGIANLLIPFEKSVPNQPGRDMDNGECQSGPPRPYGERRSDDRDACEHTDKMQGDIDRVAMFVRENIPAEGGEGKLILHGFII